MFIADMVWTKENVNEFVSFYTLQRSKIQRVMLISYFICAAFICVFGVGVFIATKEITIIMIALGAFLVIAGYIVFFYLTMKSMAKKLIEVNIENNGLEVCFNDEVIFVRKDNTPAGLIEWSGISEIYTAKNAAYLMSKENALILIEYEHLTTGSKEDFIKLLDNKKENIIKNNPNKK